MKASVRPGDPVSLYTFVPQQLVDWANTDEAALAVRSAASEAERAIAMLNKDREVKREELLQPITL